MDESQIAPKDILLNRLKLSLDAPSFERSWQCLVVVKDDGKWFGGSIVLDEVQEFGAVSVAYAKMDDQNRAYLLVPADRDKVNGVRRLFRTDEDFACYTVRPVSIGSVPDYIVANLLLNAADAVLSSDEEGTVSHVTSSCYVMDPSMKTNPSRSKDGRWRQFTVVSLSVTDEMCLAASAVTFSSLALLKKYRFLNPELLGSLPKYRLDGYSLHRVASYDDAETTYVRRNPFSTKAGMPFMNARVLETGSRIAIASRYLRIVNELFEPYAASLAFTTEAGQSCSWTPREVDCEAMLPSSRVAVVYSDDDEDVGGALLGSLATRGIEAAKKDAPENSEPSLVVLPHGRSWYEEREGIEDPYENADRLDAAVQRLDADELRAAIEADDKKRQRDGVGNALNSIVSTSILNLAVKKDIVDVVYGKKPSSMMPDFVPEGVGGFAISIPLIDKLDKKNWKPLSDRFSALATMRFDENGGIEFSIVDRDELYDTDEGEAMADALTYRTEGFVNYEGRLLVVEHTDMVPIPDWEGYSAFSRKTYGWSIPFDVLLDFEPASDNRDIWQPFVVMARSRRHPRNVTRKWVIDEIEACDEETAAAFGLKPARYKAKLRSIAEDAVRAYDPSKRLRLTKDAGVREVYWKSLYGINWFRLADRPDSLFWCSGIHSFAIGSNYTLDKAPNVREVRSLSGQLPPIEWLIDLLDVQFVRLKNVTVLPFPFKYLREYVAKYGSSDIPVEFDDSGQMRLLFDD